MIRDFFKKNWLTPREIDVAELVVQGLSNSKVAAKLGITDKGVKYHLTNIYKKLEVKSRMELLVKCVPQMFPTQTAGL